MKAISGCVLVDTDKLQAVKCSLAYGNKYIHKWNSIILSHLKETEIEQQMKLGLVTQNLINNEDDKELDYNVEDGEKISVTMSKVEGFW